MSTEFGEFGPNCPVQHVEGPLPPPGKWHMEPISQLHLSTPHVFLRQFAHALLRLSACSAVCQAFLVSPSPGLGGKGGKGAITLPTFPQGPREPSHQQLPVTVRGRSSSGHCVVQLSPPLGVSHPKASLCTASCLKFPTPLVSCIFARRKLFLIGGWAQQGAKQLL